MNVGAAESAEHWERMAVEAQARAKWNRERGIDLSSPGMSVGDHQAAMFRKTAEALRREAATGNPHCSTCGGPHPPHKHPFIAASCGCQCKKKSCLWCKQ